MKIWTCLMFICILTLLFTPIAQTEEASFIYQPQGTYVYIQQDGQLLLGSLFLVQNSLEIPLYFDAFDVPVLDSEGNVLTTAFMESCSPKFIMPSEFGVVWCTTKPVAITSEQLSSIADPQTTCFGFPKLIDASENLSISDEKCGVITREDGEPSLRISVTVTNTGNSECSGNGGFFRIEGVGDDAPSFPVAFKADAFLGELAPGESVEVGVELTDLQLNTVITQLGYPSFDPETFRFTAHAFATKTK